MNPEILAAQWQLQQIVSDDVPAIAAALMAAGYESPRLVELAGLTRPTGDEIGPLLPKVLADLGVAPLDNAAAGRVLAAYWAGEIAAGRLEPHVGADRIWTVSWYACGQPEDLTAFVGMASQYDDLPDQRGAIDAEIVAYAREYLRNSGGSVA